MGEEFATVLEWRGSHEIGLRLAALIPDGINSNLSQESIEQEGGASLYKLEINVEANSLQELRKIVDNLLALFSDQDQ